MSAFQNFRFKLPAASPSSPPAPSEEFVPSAADIKRVKDANPSFSPASAKLSTLYAPFDKFCASHHTPSSCSVTYNRPLDGIEKLLPLNHDVNHDDDPSSSSPSSSPPPLAPLVTKAASLLPIHRAAINATPLTFPFDPRCLAFLKIPPAPNHPSLPPSTSESHPLCDLVDERWRLIKKLLFGTAINDDEEDVDRSFDIFTKHGCLGEPIERLPGSNDPLPLLSLLTWKDWPPLVHLLRYYLSDPGYKDYELASNILILLSSLDCFSDPLCLAETLLAIIDHFPFHNSHCVDDPDDEDLAKMRTEDNPQHMCHEVDNFFDVLGIALSCGTPSFGIYHYLVLHATLRMELSELSAAASDEPDKSKTKWKDMKNQIKRELTFNHGFKTAQMKTQLLEKIIEAVGQLSIMALWSHDPPDSKKFSHAYSDDEYKRIMQTMASFAEPSSSPSWYWCMETLTEIGEDIVRRFPPHGDETDFLGVAFVNAIVKAHSFFPRPAPRYRFSPFFPTRYADAVRTATSRRQSSRLWNAKADVKKLHALSVQLVRLLFLRDLVGVQLSIGWGDFLIFMDEVPDLFDPLLFMHDINYTEDSVHLQGHRLATSLASSLGRRSMVTRLLHEGFKRSVDPDLHQRLDCELLLEAAEIPGIEPYPDEQWDLNKAISPLYDYSLMLLNAEFSKRWTRESHWSFPPVFRDAVLTLFLVGWRHHLPPELTSQIVEFLPRTFWNDEAYCAYPQCSMDHFIRVFDGKAAKKPQLTTCKCNIRFYCKHGVGRAGPNARTLRSCAKEYIYEGHKRECCVGACSFPLNAKESAFLSRWEEGRAEEEGEEEEEEGEWEDVGSSEEEEDLEAWGDDGEGGVVVDLDGLEDGEFAQRKSEAVRAHFVKAYTESGRWPWIDGEEEGEEGEEEEGGGQGAEEDEIWL